MAARATSSGTISFGLVSIPVKVYPAASSKSVRFNMLHKTDKSRLKQQYTCATCGEVVPTGERVKGYEYARDQYVVMTDEEIKALETQSDKAIEIEEFIPIERVDPVYFGTSQLLGPDKGGQKAYQLLNEAMTKMGRVAVGRFNTRGKQQLVLVRPMGRGLALHGLHYADEVRSFDDIEFGDPVSPKKGELDLAEQLIEQLSSEKFAPEQYEDAFRQAVLAAVDRKVAGEEVVIAPKAEAKEQIIDLMAALKQSLGERKGGRPAAKKAGPAKVSSEKARARKPAKAKGAASSGRKKASRS